MGIPNTILKYINGVEVQKMKKISLILVLLVIVALPFVFANNGAQLLEEKGYSAKISEDTELFLDPENSCLEDSCELTRSGNVIQFS